MRQFDLKRGAALCVAAAAPVLFSGNVFAQASTPEAAAEAAGQEGGYTLKVDTLVNPASVQQSTTAYELKGTSISGGQSRYPTIRTAPVDPSMAAFKAENGLYIYPTVGLDYGFNDNLTWSNRNAIASSFMSLAPAVILESRTKANRLTASLGFDNTTYFSSTADNFTTSKLAIAGDNYFTARARSGWQVGLVNGIDPRGTTDRALTAEPDKWHSSNVNGTFIYGAPEAPGRIEVEAGQQAKVYDNNRATTAVADVTVNSFGGRFYYRLGTRSLALAELRQDNASYASALANSDNVERRYYLGFTWEATASSTGTIKLGQLTKDYSGAGRNNFAGSSWEATARWLPRTYSAVDIQSSKATVDGTGVGGYSVNTRLGATWNHKWSGQVSSRVGLSNTLVDYQGAGSTRQDTVNQYSLGLQYQFRRWLSLGVSYSGLDRTSNAAGTAFTRNVTMFTLDGSL